MNTQFHYLSRAIIIHNAKVLLAHQIGAGHTFLPGGHIKVSEKAETALIREILEELGKEATIKRFIGAVEAGWEENAQGHHEINLVFEASIFGIDSSRSPNSLEGHLEFIWSELNDLGSYNLLPEPLIQCLVSWNRDYDAFWGTAFRK